MKHRSEIEKMSLEDLKQLYIEETRILHDQLIHGTPWEKAEIQRKYVSAIGVLIDIKSNIFNTSKTL